MLIDFGRLLSLLGWGCHDQQRPMGPLCFLGRSRLGVSTLGGAWHLSQEAPSTLGTGF